MITSSLWRGKRYAVLGLARSGTATVHALLASGAQVVAWDSDEQKRVGLGGAGLTLADPLTLDLTGFTAVIVSPGVPLNRHPIAAHAAAHAVPVIGDIELFAQARAELPPHKVVGITGTNGKSTTTALVHHILKTVGVPTTMGGNIGLPILAQYPLPSGGTYVLELSSYQIDLTHSLACDVAVLTNITPDHLDRYDGDFLAYCSAKARLFTMQHADHHAVIATDDDPSRMVASHVSHRLKRVSTTDINPDDQVGWPSLQGPHNAQNAACAIAAASALGLTDDQIASGLASFTGLPHRMERVAEANGILFVNDSKATNTASTAPALAAYPPATDGRPRIHWIAGGLAKEDGLGECAAHLANVARAYLIGDAAPMLARHLAGQVLVEHSGTLDAAVRDAMAHARSGDVILLSPAAASFDQFRDFEARGSQFRAIVTSIIASGGAQA